jgi:hypothetical protein
MLSHMFMSAEEAKKMFQKGLENALKNIDINALVCNAADKAIRESVENYFEYGNGAHAVRGAVHAKLDALMPVIMGDEAVRRKRGEIEG